MGADVITAVAVLIIALFQGLQWLEFHLYRRAHEGAIVISKIPRQQE